MPRSNAERAAKRCYCRAFGASQMCGPIAISSSAMNQYLVNSGVADPQLLSDLRGTQNFTAQHPDPVVVYAGLGPNRIPLDLASSRPSFVPSRMRSRSAWATADRMVMTILPIASSSTGCRYHGSHGPACLLAPDQAQDVGIIENLSDLSVNLGFRLQYFLGIIRNSFPFSLIPIPHKKI